MKIYFLLDTNSYFKSESSKHFSVFTDFVTTERAVANKQEIVYTTSLIHLSLDLMDDGYEILIDNGLQIYEVKLGQNSWTQKDIKKSHNILKLFQSVNFFII